MYAICLADAVNAGPCSIALTDIDENSFDSIGLAQVSPRPIELQYNDVSYFPIQAAFERLAAEGLALVASDSVR